MTVADRIKYLREKQGMSQETLANKIGLKDKSSIAKIEKSGDKITLKNVEKLSEVLNCSIAYLMGWEENYHYNTEPLPPRFVSEEHDAYNAKAKKTLTENEKRFLDTYSKLSEDQKRLVENMMKAFLEK